MSRATPRTTCELWRKELASKHLGRAGLPTAFVPPRTLTLCGYGLSLNKGDAMRKWRFCERGCGSSGFHRLHQAKHETHPHAFPGACSQDQKMLSWQPSSDWSEARGSSARTLQKGLQCGEPPRPSSHRDDLKKELVSLQKMTWLQMSWGHSKLTM